MSENRVEGDETGPQEPSGMDFPPQDAPSFDANDYVLELDEDVSGESMYKPGDDFAEHRLVRLVTRDATAEFWEAYDSHLDCVRGIKVLRPEIVHQERTVDLFFQQARAQARLQHTNVLQVQRVGRWGGEAVPFFVVEWINGESLQARLDRDGALSPVAAWDILRQIIAGLGYALEQGMIHRDLHPGNIMLEDPIRDSGDRRVRVKIKDFGLAAIFDSPNQGQAPVLPGSRPEYTAPEIVTGMEVGHRADIYSLGILLYQMLTGFAPFQGGKRGDILFKQVHDPLPALPPPVREAIGPEGMAILARMTQKRPDLRFASYDDLQEATQTSPIMNERRKPSLQDKELSTPTERGIPAPVHPTPRGVPLAAEVSATAPVKKNRLPLIAAVIVLVAGVVWLLPRLQKGASVVNPEPLVANSSGAVPEAGKTVVTTPSLEAALSDAPTGGKPDGGESGESDESAGAGIGSLSALIASEEAKSNSAPTAGDTGEQPQAPGPGVPVWSSLVSAGSESAPGEIIVDNAAPGALRLTPTSPGTWRLSSQPGAHAYSSLQATADGTEKTATFLADIPQGGEYEVFVSWISGGSNTRSGSVVCTIHTADGPFKGIVDQVGPANSGGFFPVGRYKLAAGKAQPVVTLSTDGVEPGPDRVVSVDALKLVLLNGSDAVSPPVEMETAEAESGEEAMAEVAVRLPAGAIVVESGVGGKNHEQYEEISGRWLDSRAPAAAAKSLASGLSSVEDCPGRKYVFSVVGSDTAAPERAEARFRPELDMPGRFHVYVTWPYGGNITPIQYVVRHANGMTTRSLTQDGYGPGPGTPNNANVWIRLGEFDFAPGKENYVSLVVEPGARALHTTANGQAYADAVCFSPAPVEDAQEDDRTTLRSVMAPGGVVPAREATPIGWNQ